MQAGEEGTGAVRRATHLEVGRGRAHVAPRVPKGLPPRLNGASGGHSVTSERGERTPRLKATGTAPAFGLSPDSKATSRIRKAHRRACVVHNAKNRDLCPSLEESPLPECVEQEASHDHQQRAHEDEQHDVSASRTAWHPRGESGWVAFVDSAKSGSTPQAERAVDSGANPKSEVDTGPVYRPNLKA